MSFSADELLLARSSPAGFASVVSEGRWVPFPHLVLLNDRILAAVSGDLGRQGKTGLIVSMPPRHGKSEEVSKYLPAWLLGRFPDRRVILASYQAHFAAQWGRRARELLEQYGPEVFGIRVSQASSAADHWEVHGHQGAMATAGAGGPITGKGADLLVVDDPVKNAEEAASQVIRDKVWEWWRSTARTRIHAGGAAIVVMTRWHEDDLVGRLLAAAADDPDADQWELVELEAICTRADDPVGRKPGQALCPELGYDEAWARKTRASVGTYYWEALYQQTPRPAEGLLFKRQDFRYFTVDAESGLYLLERVTDDGNTIRHPVDRGHCLHFQTVDVAASEKETADYTVVSTWAATPDRDLLLVDVERQRFELLDVGGLVERQYRRHEPAFTAIEQFGHGLGVVQELVRKGLPIRRLDPDRDKVARALVAVARYEEHRVYHRRGAGWLRGWEDELTAFPNAANDDQVDTVAYAARLLPTLSAERPRRREPKGRTRFGGVRDWDL